MKTYVISIDQSTTSTKVFLMDTKGNIIKETAKKHKQIYPENGWVEHDAMEIYQNMMDCLHQILHTINQEDEVLGICLTNQRETTVIWDMDSGLPLYHAIVWQCRRTIPICESLKAYETIVEEKTGLKIDPYFSATKLKWLLNHVDTPVEKIMAGTMDSWLLYKLCGKHVCDHTNASRTLLYHLKDKKWDDELLKIFDIPKCILPEIVYSDGNFGSVEIDGRVIPILSVIGDSQSALYAHQAFKLGDVKVTMGTGSSVMMNLGKQLPEHHGGVVGALAYHTTKKDAYAGEAIINASADTLNWLRDDLGLYEKDQMLNDISMNAHGVYLVPAFVGLGIPYWMSRAKACISGISRNTTKTDIVVAGMQSIAYQIYDAICALEENADISATRISADGGASKNPALMQFLADICDKDIITYKQSAFSAFGVYLLGLQKLGYACDDLQKIDQIYHPKMDKETRMRYIEGWKLAVDVVVYDADKRGAL